MLTINDQTGKWVLFHSETDIISWLDWDKQLIWQLSAYVKIMFIYSGALNLVTNLQAIGTHELFRFI